MPWIPAPSLFRAHISAHYHFRIKAKSSPFIALLFIIVSNKSIYVCTSFGSQFFLSFSSLSCFLPSKQTKRRLMLTSRAHIISSDENGCRARKKSQHIKDTLVINFKTKEAVFILAAIFILTHSLTRSHARILSENAKQISNGWFASLCAHALCSV